MHMPLTAFLIALMKASPESLANPDHQKLADKYGVRVADVAGYLRLHRK